MKKQIINIVYSFMYCMLPHLCGCRSSHHTKQYLFQNKSVFFYQKIQFNSNLFFYQLKLKHPHSFYVHFFFHYKSSLSGGLETLPDLVVASEEFPVAIRWILFLLRMPLSFSTKYDLGMFAVPRTVPGAFSVVIHTFSPEVSS